MIKGIQFHFLFKKATAIPFHCTFYSDSVLLANFSRRKIRRALPDDPGMRIRRGAVQVNLDYPDEIMGEHELDDHVDLMKADQAYDEDVREKRRFEKKVEKKIIINKFFSRVPQPSMLTYNERLCIQYLNKQDPVQWNLKTLSESFPATPDIIKKILRSKRKITPEIAKIMDMKVQKNWELLSKGELRADSDVLNHLKKFVNKRKVLLEQIKNEKFYLPEVKQETTWNQGEMSRIISHYEKLVKKLEPEQNPKKLSDGSNAVEIENEEEKKSNLDLVHAKIKVESENLPKTTDSSLYGDMINTYSKSLTLEELESKILRKADDKKKLDLTEKVILEDKLGIRKENEEVFMSKFSNVMEERASSSQRVIEKLNKKFDDVIDFKSNSMKSKMIKPDEVSYMLDYIPPDENTLLGYANNVGKILNELQQKPETAKNFVEVKEKKEIDFSEPERKNRENAYYEAEVSHIKDTAFWDSKRSSREKVLAESKKIEVDVLVNEEDFKNPLAQYVFHPDPYPERIKVPRNKRGSGLTFRVKDCYYDDDGEFLYRVPGMLR